MQKEGRGSRRGRRVELNGHRPTNLRLYSPELGSKYFLKRVLAEHLSLRHIPITKFRRTALKSLKREAIFKRFFPYFLETFLSGTLDNYSLCNSFDSNCQVVL